MGIIGTLRAKLDSTIDSITVVATDLSTRALTFATDSVDVSGSDITATVDATDLDIRDLSSTTDSVSNIVKGVDYVSGNSGIDASTETLQSITYEHHEIHAGSHYNYCDYALKQAAAATIEFVLTTPNTTTWTHLVFDAYSSAGATLEIYEGTSGVTGGTTITPRNNNRNSDNESTITLIKDPAAITTDGTRAAGFMVGGTREAGLTSREREYVLKQNTTYLLRITSLATSNDIGWCSEWYEHADKN